jgi:hypothetical protein
VPVRDFPHAAETVGLLARPGVRYSGPGMLLARARTAQAQDPQHNVSATSTGAEASPAERCLFKLSVSRHHPRRQPAQQQFPVSLHPMYLRRASGSITNTRNHHVR